MKLEVSPLTVLGNVVPVVFYGIPKIISTNVSFVAKMRKTIKIMAFELAVIEATNSRGGFYQWLKSLLN